MIQPHVAETLHAHRRRDIDLGLLLRRLLDQQEWYVPVAPTGEDSAELLILDREGRLELMAFTSLAAAEAWAAGVELPRGAYLLAVGPEVLVDATAGPDLDLVRFDAGLPHEVALQAQDFDRFDQVAQAAEVEREIEAMATHSGDLEVLLAHDRWYVAAVGDEVATLLDEEGARLAAVFTTLDALEAWFDAVGPNLPGEPREVSAAPLFRSLYHTDVEGICFNCAGPAATTSFGRELIEALALDEE
jgi:hypothetical protein